jgi:hypothetical protein
MGLELEFLFPTGPIDGFKFVPLFSISISFSRSVRSDHVFTDLGNTRRRRKLPRL